LSNEKIVLHVKILSINFGQKYGGLKMDSAIKFAEILKNKEVVIFSGAGMSTESGLQDFRSKTGLWANVDPTALASVDALKNNYEQFLSFYISRLLVPESVKPNIGHKLLAEWESDGYIKGIITQNVDRLHQAAGSVNVAELHGSLEPIRCYRCDRIALKDSFIQGKRCSCGGRLRPGVVLFGEMLPESEIQKADLWSNNCRSFVVLGSSLTVSPANFFPQKAKNSGANLVIVNKDDTPLDEIADLVVHKSIGKFLSEVLEFVTKP
jgi:NAD-dependent deacetylase